MWGARTQLELELIQTQMAQKPMLRAEVYARALRACQKRERGRMYGWARDAPDEWAGRGRVREWKATFAHASYLYYMLGR